MDKPVLMIGWEFPPHHSGGLGVACHGLARGLLTTGLPIAFFLPKYDPSGQAYRRLNYQYAPGLEMAMIQVNANLEPYWQSAVDSPRSYPVDMITEVERYGQVVGEVSRQFSPSLVHAHDWMSIPAGVQASQQTKRPLVVHIHSTARDRSGGGWPHAQVEAIERWGLNRADRVVAVSHYTKQQLVQDYGIPADKIDVVYNGVDPNPEFHTQALPNFLQDRPVIVFVGRLTIQKGPEYFLAVARQVLTEVKNAVFVFAGQGDMYHQLLVSSAYQGMSGSVLFAGFLHDREKDYLYRRADVFVMPSVSEPFGISALEAALTETPVIVAKSAGVAEVLPHAYAIDFWDVNRMTATILELIHNRPLQQERGQKVSQEAKQMTWQRAAQALRQVYRLVLG